MIDMHIHTTASDGTDDPAVLLRNLKDKGIRSFSVTDHDTFSGCQPVAELVSRDPWFRFTWGIELSCRDDHGKYHILGYGFRPEGESIRAAVQEAHENRMSKVRVRLDYLAEHFGIRLTEEELQALLANPNPGKPHFGNLLVQKGIAPDRDTAIRDYVNKCPTLHLALDPGNAIREIRESGGIPILAHGYFGNGEQNLGMEELTERVDRLLELGLMGVECFYSRYTRQQQEDLLSLAEKRNLLISAGSDYHGTNKRVALGQTGLGEEADWPAGLRRLTEMLGLR